MTKRTEAFGMAPLWVVTRATADSTLQDVLFTATPREFAQQVLGGLQPDEVVGWFERYSDANQYALQELERANAVVGWLERYSAVNHEGAKE